jgi:hypothetical protein
LKKSLPIRGARHRSVQPSSSERKAPRFLNWPQENLRVSALETSARFSPFGPLGIISPVLRKPLILGFIFLVDHGPDVIIQVANFGFQLGFGEALTFGGNDKIVG